jgi:hypothetical protein
MAKNNRKLSLAGTCPRQMSTRSWVLGWCPYLTPCPQRWLCGEARTRRISLQKLSVSASCICVSVPNLFSLNLPHVRSRWLCVEAPIKTHTLEKLKVKLDSVQGNKTFVIPLTRPPHVRQCELYPVNPTH